MNYELELKKAASYINNQKAKKVCIQLADGLKPLAQEIQDYLEQNTKTNILIWLGSAFGACDIPLEIKSLGVDLLIQWGHSEYIM